VDAVPAEGVPADRNHVRVAVQLPAQLAGQLPKKLLHKDLWAHIRGNLVSNRVPDATLGCSGAV